MCYVCVNPIDLTLHLRPTLIILALVNLAMVDVAGSVLMILILVHRKKSAHINPQYIGPTTILLLTTPYHALFPTIVLSRIPNHIDT